MNSTVQNAYRIVLNDILNSNCGLMVGKYDAKNGSNEYMAGISTVMEWIAYRTSEADGDAFSEMFIKNLLESERKALTKWLEYSILIIVNESEVDKNENNWYY